MHFNKYAKAHYIKYIIPSEHHAEAWCYFWEILSSIGIFLGNTKLNRNIIPINFGLIQGVSLTHNIGI